MTQGFQRFGLVLAISCIWSAVGALAEAKVINVDFDVTNTGASGTYSGQGVYSDPGNNAWNGEALSAKGSPFASFVSSPLLASD